MKSALSYCLGMDRLMSYVQLIVFAIIIFAARGSTVNAATLRCQGTIIDLSKSPEDFQKNCSQPLMESSFTEKYVKYLDAKQNIESSTVKKYLIDDGSSSYVFLVQTTFEKIEIVKQVYIDKDMQIRNCKELPHGMDRIVFKKYCGSPVSKVSQREEIPERSSAQNSQPLKIRQVEEEIYKWGEERWKLIFMNDALAFKQKL